MFFWISCGTIQYTLRSQELSGVRVSDSSPEHTVAESNSLTSLDHGFGPLQRGPTELDDFSRPTELKDQMNLTPI